MKHPFFLLEYIFYRISLYYEDRFSSAYLVGGGFLFLVLYMYLFFFLYFIFGNKISINPTIAVGVSSISGVIFGYLRRNRYRAIKRLYEEYEVDSTIKGIVVLLFVVFPFVAMYILLSYTGIKY